MATATKTKEMTNHCVCGCGELCHKLFAPGHDQRVRGWLLRREAGKMVQTDPKELPKSLTAAIADGRLNADALKHPTPTVLLVVKRAKLPHTPKAATKASEPKTTKATKAA